MKIEKRDMVLFGWVGMGLILCSVMLTDTNLTIEQMQKDVVALLCVVSLAMFTLVGGMYSHEIYMGERKKKGLHKWTRENMDELEERVKALEEKLKN